eukprot:12430944-Karenia_brevis.AAC.1
MCAPAHLRCNCCTFLGAPLQVPDHLNPHVKSQGNNGWAPIPGKMGGWIPCLPQCNQSLNN